MSSCWIKQPTQWEKTFAHCTKKTEINIQDLQKTSEIQQYQSKQCC